MLHVGAAASLTKWKTMQARASLDRPGSVLLPPLPHPSSGVMASSDPCQNHCSSFITGAEVFNTPLGSPHIKPEFSEKSSWFLTVLANNLKSVACLFLIHPKNTLSKKFFFNPSASIKQIYCRKSICRISWSAS